MTRVQILCAAVVLVCIGVATAATVLHAAPASAPSPQLAGTDIWPAGSRPAPSFALRDQTGQIVHRSDLRGQIWAITFLDSHCTKACPIEARALAAVQRQLGPTTPLKVIIVSVLPQYDTPARVRAFAHENGLTSNWHWLLGTQAQLAPVWKKYGIWVVTGIEHTAAVYLVDRQGNVRVADSVPFLQGQFVASVRALSKEANSGA